MRVVKDFIGKPAPPGYVAGIGRGATGFTTRSDIGPAREFGDKNSRGKKKQSDKDKANESDEEALNDNNYDDFEGYKSSLFSKDAYDSEDEEADAIYNLIDQQMKDRSKRYREKKDKEMEQKQKVKLTIHQQFADCKRDLSKLSEHDWMAIPEVGDARNRKQRVNRLNKITPITVKQSALQGLVVGAGTNVYAEDVDMEIDDEDIEKQDEEQSSNNVDSDDIKPSTSGTDFVKSEQSTVFQARKIKLEEKLHNHSQERYNNQEASTNDQDTIDKTKETEPSNLLQLKNAKTISTNIKYYTSMVKRDPRKPLPWLGLANLLERSGKVNRARAALQRGCEFNPKEVSLWLELTRLSPKNKAKEVLVRAIQERPNSDRLWIAAADYEEDCETKKRIFIKSLTVNPSNIILRQKALEYAKGSEIEELLKEGVKHSPNHVEFWISLSQIFLYDGAKEILCDAIEKNLNDVRLRVASAKLEESYNKQAEIVAAMIDWAIEDMSKQISLGNLENINWEAWKNEAIISEQEKCIQTSNQIITKLFAYMNGKEYNENFDEFLLKQTNSFIEANAIECARASFKFMTQLEVNKTNENVWISFVEFERAYGNQETLKEALEKSVDNENCRNSVKLWLDLAKERSTNINEARLTLARALEANPDSEKIIIAAVQLESQNANHDEARRILRDACKSAKTSQLCMEWAKLELSQNNIEEATKLLTQATDEFKNCPDIFLMFGQVEEQRNLNNAAMKQYANGLKYNPTSAELWIAYAKLEEKSGSIPRARSRFQMSRSRLPHNVDLWLESARLEIRANKQQTALSLLATAARECKSSPGFERLEAELQALEPKQKRMRLDIRK